MILFAQERPFFDWSWVARNLDQIWERTLEHLTLTGFALGVGLVISVVLSVLALTRPRTYEPIASVSGLVYTIPSLAMFALVAPFVGIGTQRGAFVTAEVALISYTLLILVRNIVSGLRGVPAETKEAAVGMGHTPGQVLRQIEMPLALPVIVAGVRIATVTVVGLVTVTSLLGLGGLGFFILNGLRKSIIFPTEIIVGVVLSVVLAALLDIVLLWLGRRLSPWSTRAST
jgi:osmoprotectant transport system permease protein